MLDGKICLWTIINNALHIHMNNHLPVPPRQKLLYFIILVRILKQLKNADIKTFRVSHKISVGEDLG